MNWMRRFDVTGALAGACIVAAVADATFDDQRSTIESRETSEVRYRGALGYYQLDETEIEHRDIQLQRLVAKFRKFYAFLECHWSERLTRCVKARGPHGKRKDTA